MRTPIGRAYCAIALLLCCPLSLVWAQTAPLPQPLSLEAAMALAEEDHPDLRKALAELDAKRADREVSNAADDVQLDLLAKLQFVEPARVVRDTDRERYSDHHAEIVLSKRLYDFGRSDALARAADAAVSGSEQAVFSARQARRLEVMRRFFDVILADLTFARDNEAMATDYVTWDRAQNRNALGQFSDVDLLELESIYQRTRHKRAVSQSEQRASRARLANSLNRPGELPGDLTAPELPKQFSEVGELQPLVDSALQNHPDLNALKTRMEAAAARLGAARSQRWGDLTASLRAATYSEAIGARDYPLALDLTYRLPLSSGGRVDGEVARAQADLDAARADADALALAIQQAVLEVWLELDNLRLRGEELKVLTDFRELNMDRARVLYEQQKKADLGDSMVLISDLTLEQTRWRFDSVMARARLDALRGKPIGMPAEGENKP
ncbi:MAG: TolC family protein [Chromatiales bacterium]|nr:TolC family protein [Chromatiales bacterium]